MIKKIQNLLPLASVMFVLLLSACVTDGTQKPGRSSATPPTAETFEIWALQDQQPPRVMTSADADLRRVLQSAVARVRGHSQASIAAAWGVAGEDRRSYARPEFADFTVSRVLLQGGNPSAAGSSPRAIEGVIEFIDAVGREAAMGFNMTYGVASAGETATALNISEMSLAPIYQDEPDVTLLVAPVEALNGLSKDTASDFAKLHRAVSQVALRIHQPSSLPDGADEYGFVAFLNGRLAPGDRIQISHLATPDQAQGDSSASYYRSFDKGWAVAVLRRQVDVQSADKGWIRVTLIPDAKGPRLLKTPRTLGLFAAGSQENALRQLQALVTGD